VFSYPFIFRIGEAAALIWFIWISWRACRDCSLAAFSVRSSFNDSLDKKHQIRSGSQKRSVLLSRTLQATIYGVSPLFVSWPSGLCPQAD